ncbi:hypothetical protein [Fredinandcohnia sp. 179-A 10B2 NHS]|uniref:hypothetical protein n=1 Tax=Fredinandcohnia sp. 179-A 10B2 NHS TaxID=3235176 RepID=UPI0039A0FDD1
MRFSDKSNNVQNSKNEVFGVDFHDFIQKEQGSTYVELASEFGVSVRDVRNLKRQLHRS